MKQTSSLRSGSSISFLISFTQHKAPSPLVTITGLISLNILLKFSSLFFSSRRYRFTSLFNFSISASLEPSLSFDFCLEIYKGFRMYPRPGFVGLITQLAIREGVDRIALFIVTITCNNTCNYQD